MAAYRLMILHRPMHFHCRALLGLAGFACAVLPVRAADIRVVGLFPNKALVQLDGSPPRTLSPGQAAGDGITLVSVERDGATFDMGGTRRTIRLGQAQSTGNPSGNRSSVTLTANAQGHFLAQGQINGLAVDFVVDTGATLVSLSAADARRLGLSYLGGAPVSIRTANGTTRAWRIRLDTVRIGDISINGVDGVILENQDMPPLLGMSFLNRMDMRREGQQMVLTRRF